jgi:Na+/proline symporter
MDIQWHPEAVAAFCAVLIATFITAWKGHRDAGDDAERHIAHQRLNRWLVGLSAGATANSGFVVTGAVGLGYSYGLYWLLLPFGWFLGDLVFWRYFPHRINAYGAQANATTLADVIGYGLRVGRFHPLVIASSAIVVLCLGGYTMAQWVAGQKFLEGAFGVSGHWTLLVFAAVIVAYTSLGRFRGSVYADTLQAVTRMLGTLVALGTVSWWAMADTASFAQNIGTAGDGFLSILGGGTVVSAIGFVLGYAAASLGFGLGQPQVTTRYLAARSPQETRAAQWIYIGYVQCTWATMTVFGVLLRGVMPGLTDPEKGLTVFASSALPPLLVGFIVADIFGAIASTANSLLVSMAQATRDLLGTGPGHRVPFWALSLGLGLATMLASATLAGDASVFTLAISSVSLMAAGLAPAVAIKVLRWPHTALSLTVAVFAGVAAALAWKITGLSNAINESAIGIPLGLIANYALTRRIAASMSSAPQRHESEAKPVPDGR